MIEDKLSYLENKDKLHKDELQNIKNKCQELESDLKPIITNTITIGGGCFWCIEGLMQRVKGVLDCKSGYSGGHLKHPTYKDIKSGKTGHAEVISLTYDTTQITYADLLYIFLHIHDPTTKNKQMYDKGTQYRSIILYNNSEEKYIAQQVINLVQKENVYKDKIITELKQFDQFYVAEDRHQNYYNSNSDASYCKVIIDPKLQKFIKQFSAIQKEEYQQKKINQKAL